MMEGGGDSDCENDLQEKRVAAKVTVKINSHKPELVMQRPGKNSQDGRLNPGKQTLQPSSSSWFSSLLLFSVQELNDLRMTCFTWKEEVLRAAGVDIPATHLQAAASLKVEQPGLC